MRFNKKILALFLIAGATILNSCEKDEPDISTSDRDKFLGEYAAQSNGPGGQRNFTMTITTSNSSPTQIRLVNFDDSNGTTVFAEVSDNSLTIPTQSVSGETYQGNGTLSGVNLSITFTIDDGQTVENRTLTGTRQ